MSTPVEHLAVMLPQYDQYWMDYISRVEHRLYLLKTLKQGMELLLLVGSYLFFYLIDCVSQVVNLPVIR